jgi:hypothetical protein
VLRHINERKILISQNIRDKGYEVLLNYLQQKKKLNNFIEQAIIFVQI